MAGGRPTDYRHEYCDRIIEHFDKEPFTSSYDEASGKTYRSAILLPTLTNFARSIGVARSTIYKWAEEHQEFSDAIKRAQELQEEVLMQNGLFGAYDKTFAIFTAKNICGWKDKQEIDHSGRIDSAQTVISGEISPEQAAEAYAKLMG